MSPQCPQYTPAVDSLSPQSVTNTQRGPDSADTATQMIPSDCVRVAGYKYFCQQVNYFSLLILIEIVSAWDQAQSAQVKMREGSLAQQFRLIKELILVTKGALTGTKSVH